jgi:hypothetical protein
VLGIEILELDKVHMYVYTGPAKLLGKNSSAHLHRRKNNLFSSKEQFFCGQQNLSSLHKKVEIS